MTTEQIESIIESMNLSTEYFTWQIGNCDESMDSDSRLELFYQEEILPDCSLDRERVLALMEHTGGLYDEAESCIDSDYKVLTDEEADKLLEEYLNSYMWDHVLREIPEHLHKYFDEESWLEDNMSDRGAWLNYCDGCEYEETINETTYYIYKQ